MPIDAASIYLPEMLSSFPSGPPRNVNSDQELAYLLDMLPITPVVTLDAIVIWRMRGGY